jgi:GNAT superfamily N-acetyltransferase
MRIVRWVAGDPTATQACFEVAAAVTAADDPLGPPGSSRWFRGWLEQAVEPMEMWFAPGETPGSARGWYHLDLPDLENTDRAGVNLVVHPAFRRQGVGRALLEHAVRRAAENGRSVLGSEVMQGPAEAPSAGEAFARDAGAVAGLVDARRDFIPGKVSPEQIARLRADAARAAAGYSVVSWLGPTPDEYLSGLAGVFNALNDAPRDAGWAAHQGDARRVRERIDAPYAARGGRRYSVAAVHDATGQMAAATQIGVEADCPDWGHQHITAVARQHRGHRLGLLIKTAIHEWLATAEPGLRHIVTWNAVSNQYMISINEALGYELLEPLWQSCELPVADALARGTAE